MEDYHSFERIIKLTRNLKYFYNNHGILDNKFQVTDDDNILSKRITRWFKNLKKLTSLEWCGVVLDVNVQFSDFIG